MPVNPIIDLLGAIFAPFVAPTLPPPPMRVHPPAVHRQVTNPDAVPVMRLPLPFKLCRLAPLKPEVVLFDGERDPFLTRSRRCQPPRDAMAYVG